MNLSGFRLSYKISLTLFLVFLFSFTDLTQRSAPPFSQWTVLNNLPFTQEYHVAAAWRYQDTNFIITAGGRINGTTGNNVVIYNTATGQYRPLPPLPVPRVVKNGSKTRSSRPAGMPGPLSQNLSRARLGVRQV